jgi:hypothetical protein
MLGQAGLSFCHSVLVLILLACRPPGQGDLRDRAIELLTLSLVVVQKQAKQVFGLGVACLGTAIGVGIGIGVGIELTNSDSDSDPDPDCTPRRCLDSVI